MLTLDFEKRPMAGQLLEHPFFETRIIETPEERKKKWNEFQEGKELLEYN
jgi:hypothetical protein